MHDTPSSWHDLRHRPARPRPGEHEMGAAVVWGHFQSPSHVPAYFATAMRPGDVLLVAGPLELRPIFRQHIRGDDLRVIFEKAQRAAEPNAVGNIRLVLSN